MGSLLEKQGVQAVLDAIPLVRERAPAARLLVIGDGPYRRELERRAAGKGITDAVEFVGYVDDHRDLERMIAESGVAVATYDPVAAGFSYFADPGKIKNYLAAGVPVVATDVPWSARWLAERGAGRLVSYEPREIAIAILEVFDDPNARVAAASLGAESDWTRIFDEAFAPHAREQTNANE